MREEVIGDFVCGGNHMVIVRLEHGVHVMAYDEWKFIYGRLHHERWENLKGSKRLLEDAVEFKDFSFGGA